MSRLLIPWAPNCQWNFIHPATIKGIVASSLGAICVDCYTGTPV